METGSALHTVESLLHTLHQGSGEAFSGLSRDFRDEHGELLSFEFVDGRTPRRGVHINALFSNPQPCVGGSTMKQVPGNLATGLPSIAWNYAPSVVTGNLNPSYFEKICIYLELEARGLDINIARKLLELPTVSGVTCAECFAYVGASIKIALTCTSGNVKVCDFVFASSGGLQLNIDLKVQNPALSGDTGQLLLFNSSEFVTLYNNPAIFLNVRARPYLYIRLNGELAASGTASLEAKFNSSSGFAVLASSPLSIGTVDAGVGGHLSMSKPQWTSTLQLSEAYLEVSITPLVMWQFEIGKMVTALGKTTGFTTSLEVGTALTTSFNFVEKIPNFPGDEIDRELLQSNANCVSNHKVTVTASLESVTEKTLIQGSGSTLELISGPLDTGDQLVYATLPPGDTCLSGPLRTPTQTMSPTPQPTGDVVSLGLKQIGKGKLSPQAIAVIILLPLALIMLVAVILRNWCKKHKENSLPSWVPIRCRRGVSDCFVARRRDSQAALDQQRANEEQVSVDFNLSQTYDRPTSVNIMHLSDIVPSPCDPGVSSLTTQSGSNKGLPLPVNPHRLRTDQVGRL